MKSFSAAFSFSLAIVINPISEFYVAEKVSRDEKFEILTIPVDHHLRKFINLRLTSISERVKS